MAHTHTKFLTVPSPNTLIATAKLNGVEPLAYLADVLERIVSRRTKAHELHGLLPWNWRQTDQTILTPVPLTIVDDLPRVAPQVGRKLLGGSVQPPETLLHGPAW